MSREVLAHRLQAALADQLFDPVRLAKPTLLVDVAHRAVALRVDRLGKLVEKKSLTSEHHGVIAHLEHAKMEILPHVVQFGPAMEGPPTRRELVLVPPLTGHKVGRTTDVANFALDDDSVHYSHVLVLS